jgi:hypothetical protein
VLATAEIVVATGALRFGIAGSAGAARNGFAAGDAMRSEAELAAIPAGPASKVEASAAADPHISHAKARMAGAKNERTATEQTRRTLLPPIRYTPQRQWETRICPASGSV